MAVTDGPRVTVFAAPKAVVGDAATSQRNAVWSWKNLGPDVEVILLGNEAGIEDVSRELGTRHVPIVARSPAGVPLLSDVFRLGQRAARGGCCVFVNADIVFGPDLLSAIRLTSDWSDQFLMIGQRWDAPIDHRIDELGADWWRATRDRALSTGKLDSPLWIDYFAFPTGQYSDLPPFIIGRPGYDNWMVWHTRSRQIPVVDASSAVTAVHQRHTYAQYGGSKKHVWTEDAQTNADLIGDRRKLFTIGHSTNRLTPQGIEPARGSKYLLARLSTRARPVIDVTASARRKVGLDAELVQRLVTPLRRRRQR